MTGGRHGWPFGVLAEDIEGDHGYRADEFLLTGEAVRYLPVSGADWVPMASGRRGRPAARRSRRACSVYRPLDPARFNGTVIVVWNNVSAGHELFFDSLGVFDEGFAVVCATVQKVGVDGLPPAPVGLKAWDPERYGSLSIPSDDYSYDIFTQVARAVAPDRPTGPVDPLAASRCASSSPRARRSRRVAWRPT